MIRTILAIITGVIGLYFCSKNIFQNSMVPGVALIVGVLFFILTTLLINGSNNKDRQYQNELIEKLKNKVNDLTKNKNTPDVK